MNARSQDNLSVSEEETKEYAQRLLRDLEAVCVADEKSGVIFLRGDLGVGKTIFTKGLAEAMNVHDTVTSPTFVLQQEYEGESGYFKKLYHFDLYRLDEEQEIDYLDIASLLHPHVLIVIEWSEKSERLVAQLAQLSHVRIVQLEHVSPSERRITTL